MKKILTCWACLFLPPLAGAAQKITDYASDHVVLKLIPLPLYDIYNTVQLGVEVPFQNRQFTFQQELGYGHSVFSIWRTENDQVPDRHHFRARSQFRFYYRNWSRVRGYLAGEYFLRRALSSQQDWVGVGCGDSGACDFFEDKTFKVNRLVNAVHMKAGWQFYFTGRVTLDLYAGLGLRQLRISSDPAGIDFRTGSNGFLWFEENRPGIYGPYPSLACGFQVGILLGKLRHGEAP